MKKRIVFIIASCLCLMLTIGVTADNSLNLIRAIFYLEDNGEYQVNDEWTVTLTSGPICISIKRMDYLGEEYVENSQISIYDSESDLVTTITTGNEPYILSGVLEAGKTYVFRQTNNLPGHIPEEDVVLTVEDTADIQEVFMPDQEINVWTSVPGYDKTSGGLSTGGGPQGGSVTQGIWTLWDLNSTKNPNSGQVTSYDGAISYKGSGETIQDITLRIDEPCVFSPGATSYNVLAMGTTFQLENGKTYEYTVKYTSTNAGGACILWGVYNAYNSYQNPSAKHQVVAGENELTGTIRISHNSSYGNTGSTAFYFYPSNGTSSLPAGTQINFTEITLSPVEESTTAEPATAEPTTVEPTTEEETTAKPEADPNFVISKKQLALTNGFRFYLKADKTLFTESGYADPSMVIEFNNGETIVSEYVEEEQYYAFPFNDIAPHQMGYTFSATLHAYKNGKEYVSPALQYSVAQYCYDVFDAYKQYSYNQYAKLYTLLVDLLNYGAQAQIYTGTDTDNLVNADLTAEQQSHATTLSGDFVNSRNYNYETISNPSVTWQAAALNLRDSVVMRLRFAASSTDGLVVKARDDKGNEWEIDAEAFEPAGSGTYNVYFDQFNVGRMSDIVYLTVYNGETPVSNTCSFSIESYAAVIQQNADTYPDLAALTTAMMKYGKSAKAYAE